MPAPKQAKKGEKTRSLILEKAASIIAHKGFEQASIREIAKSCNVSQAAAFYHFPTKDDLINEIIKIMVKHNHELVTSTIEIQDDAFQRLIKHFHGNLKWAKLFPNDAKILMLLYYLSSINSNFALIYQNLLRVAQNRILEYLLAGQREGIFHFTEPAEFTARLIHDTLVGSFVNQEAVPSLSSSKEIKTDRTPWELFLVKVTLYRPVQ